MSEVTRQIKAVHRHISSKESLCDLCACSLYRYPPEGGRDQQDTAYELLIKAEKDKRGLLLTAGEVQEIAHKITELMLWVGLEWHEVK